MGDPKTDGRLDNLSTDWLTGLPDMVSFLKIAAEAADAMRARNEQPVVVALDLIGLKSYNERYGRDEGDDLLRDFAEVLRTSFGEKACSRFAQDHFFAISSKQDLSVELDSLFTDFKESNGHPALPVRVGAYACEPDVTISVAVDRAKIACDLDRTTWASHVTWFTSEMRDAARMKIYVLEHVDQAISEGWIKPYYQAIVRSATGHICGEEALARWEDPELGMLAPDEFIPVLEKAGLLYKVDMHMIDCVLTDMQKKRERDVTIVPVSVNISHRDLEQIDISREIPERADRAGVPHHLIKVELTESAASLSPDLFREQSDALRKQGFEVWMDDFGSGYSALNTIHGFEFDLIKMDMGFLNVVSSDRKSRSIIAGVVRTAAGLNVRTLAEGVETEEQAVFLERIGCGMLQGFYYATPLPVESVIDNVKSESSPHREEEKERAYWDTISGLTLANPTVNINEQNIMRTALTELPVGVLERRDGVWNIVRANVSCLEFFDKTGVLPRNRSNLQANPIEGSLGNEFFLAVDRCMKSHSWEVMASRLEYNTGYQFYVHLVASTPEADAFMIIAMPALLGSALGAYGDVPVGYAVLRVAFDEQRESALDAEYVYTNDLYRKWSNLKQDNLVGTSFLDAIGEEADIWLPYFYQAAERSEEAHGVVFSPRIGRRVSFNISPSPINDCCVYAFAIVGDD